MKTDLIITDITKTKINTEIKRNTVDSYFLSMS